MLSRWFHEPAGCVLHRHYRGWSMNALEVRDLGRSFGGLQALQNVTLSIAQGERRVIIGTNGAGALIQTGGIFNVTGGDGINNFVLGKIGNAYGYYRLDNGQLIINPGRIEIADEVLHFAVRRAPRAGDTISVLGVFS